MDIQTIWSWICANPLVVAILVVTEIMPFLPTKSNGICQMVLNILTKFKSGVGGAAAVMLIIGMTGCTTSTTMQMVNTELAFKQAKIDMAIASDTACKAQILSAAECLEAAKAYAVSQLGTDAALQILLAHSTDPEITKAIQAEIMKGFPAFTFKPAPVLIE